MAANGDLVQEWAVAVQQFLQNSGILAPAIILFFGSWLLMFLLGAPMIRWLRQKRWRKDVKTDAEAWQVREDTPETHQVKQGTPSMGGIGLIGVACATFAAMMSVYFALEVLTGLFTIPIRPGFWIEVWGLFLLPLTGAAHAILGFIDDWSKASGRGGLRARAKLIGQWLLATLFVFGLWRLSIDTFSGHLIEFPLLEGKSAVLTWIVGALLVLLMVGVSNAVNLTDGIDGLAAGLALQVGVALWLTLPDQREFGVASNLFWAALAGSCLGFLAYNKHPAKVFMGDTGSLALGAAVAGGAILTRAAFLLPFIACIYFLEAVSVTLQVAYFKWTKRKTGEGKRIFRRAPLHHHFELGGWSEWRVVLTFWAINLVMSAIGLILWHMKILPRFP